MFLYFLENVITMVIPSRKNILSPPEKNVEKFNIKSIILMGVINMAEKFEKALGERLRIAREY